jgi:mRNA interferase YafQ
MFTVKRSGQFKKDFKLCVKRNYDISLLFTALKILEATGTLPKEYLPHPLQGRFSGYMECHIESDWLLIWKTKDYEIHLYRLGTHSDLFKK